ncbi:MAG: class I tRNA ligase family protein [Gemmatimonadota bacterium]
MSQDDNPKKPYYITTAIDYANGAPHMGHALEKLGADAMARYGRLKGGPVHFVIGMDEHGQKVLQSADASGITPQQWVDDIAEKFTSTWSRLSVSNDDFIRTTAAVRRTQPRAGRPAVLPPPPQPPAGMDGGGELVLPPVPLPGPAPRPAG